MDFSLAASVARRLGGPVLAVVFPSACPACGRSSTSPAGGRCASRAGTALPRHQATLCRCGLPLAPGLAACGRCRRGRQPFAAGAASGPTRARCGSAIHELKYRGRRRVAERLAGAAARGRARRARWSRRATCWCPCRCTRGAGGSAASTRRSSWPRSSRGARRSRAAPTRLVRRKDTAPQAGLSAAARRRNVRRGLRGAAPAHGRGPGGGAGGRRGHDGRDGARLCAAELARRGPPRCGC